MHAPPSGSKLFHFHAVFGGGQIFDQIIGERPHLRGWRPLLWEILDPPLFTM